MSAGVPTIWQGLLSHVEANSLKFSTMRRTIIGGAACPPAMMRAFQDRYDVQVLHAWGMTEMSPLGTVCALKPGHERLDEDARRAMQAKQGRGVFGVDLKIVGEEGRSFPATARPSGELMVRGPWVISGYFKGEGGDPLVDGWFPTGDVRTIDADGYMQITDRKQGRHQVGRRMDQLDRSREHRGLTPPPTHPKKTSDGSPPCKRGKCRPQHVKNSCC